MASKGLSNVFKVRDIVSVRDPAYGAKGDGTTDDTSAINSAFASGLPSIWIPPTSSFYSVGSLSVTTASQKIFAHGATIKAKNALNAVMLALAAASVEVYGGIWDGNKSNQVDASGFVAVGIKATADNCAVRDAVIQNTKGYALGSLSVNGFTVSRCRILTPGGNGIYCDGVSADVVDMKITDNYIDCSNSDIIVGSGCIGLFGTQTAGTPHQLSRAVVTGNTLFGRAASSVVGVTVRGDRAVCSNNRLFGAYIGYSFDYPNYCNVVGNFAEGCTLYSYEMVAGTSAVTSGSNNTFTGNTSITTTSTCVGLIISGSGGAVAKHNSITSNVFVGGKYGILTSAFSTQGDCQFLTISGNNISGLQDSNGSAIYLSNTLQSSITGNSFSYGTAPVGTTTGVFLDSSPLSNITGNIFEGFQFPVVAYYLAATAYTDLQIARNIFLSNGGGVPASSTIVNLSGGATFGARCMIGPNSNSADIVTDRENNIGWRELFNILSTPEANSTAGFGSVLINCVASTARLFIKRTGTGNTGWKELMANSVSADVGNASTSPDNRTADRTIVFNTAITADRAVNLSTSNAVDGQEFKVVRTANATGAFNVNVGTGPLKAMNVAGSFCIVTYNGNTAAWMLTAYGTL